MTKVNMKKVEAKANELGNDVLKVANELKRIQSVKCRLKKQKFKSTYEAEMTAVLQEEQLLKEVRNLLCPKEKTVTQYEQADVDRLDYDETMKAIKSIQSKKTNSRWLSEVPEDNDEFRNAVRIEKMLLEHKQTVKPVEESLIRKSDLVTIIDTIKSSGDLSQERIVELLEELL